MSKRNNLESGSRGFRAAAHYIQAVAPLVPRLLESTVSVLMAVDTATQQLRQRSLEAEVVRLDEGDA